MRGKVPAASTAARSAEHGHSHRVAAPAKFFCCLIGLSSEGAMLRRLIVATLMPLVPLATACTTVATVRRPAQFIASKAPRIVWVTTTDNSQVALLSPRIRADTLGGLAEGGHYVEMPLATVQSLRARQPAPQRTLL